MKKKITASMDFEQYAEFKKFQSNLKKKLGGRITYAMAIQYLLNSNRKMKKAIKKLRKINRDNKKYLENLLKNSVSRPMIIPAAKNFDLMDPPRPPSPPRKINSAYEFDEKIKKEFAIELKQTFTGEILKPSDILAKRKIKIPAIQ